MNGRPSTYDPKKAQTFIYMLIDPRDDEIRYIGKANDVLSRLGGHLRDASRRRSRVYAWINELVASGHSPVVATLDRIPMEEWQDAERFYIKEYRDCGFDLLNISAGGNEPGLNAEALKRNGRSNAKAIHSDPERRALWELKKRIGDTLRCKYVSDECKERIKASARRLAQLKPETFGKWASL